MTEQVVERDVTVAADAAPAPIRVAWAPVPRVNLLPIEILERRQFRQVQMMLAAAVVGVVLAVAAGTLLAQRGVDDANDRLTGAQAAVDRLQTQTTKYAAAPKVIAQVEAARTARTTAMAGDVLWYRYLNDLDGARPAGVEMTSITVAVSSTAGSAPDGTPGADVLTPSGVGTLKIDGYAGQYEQVSSWLESLDKITGLSVSGLTQAAAGSTPGVTSVTFSSGAVIDGDALSHRYDQKAS